MNQSCQASRLAKVVANSNAFEATFRDLVNNQCANPEACILVRALNMQARGDLCFVSGRSRSRAITTFLGCVNITRGRKASLIAKLLRV